MADLPLCRFPTDKPFPFLHCGLVIFGPFPVFNKSTDPVHQKRYGLLITCLITRAVHVELTYSLSADSFINSFRRLVSRRGCPRSIKSDRATNLVGANKSLNEAIKVLNSSDIANFFAVKEIHWEFNPASAPHFGGVWERLIWSFKDSMYSVIGSKMLTEEILLTVFAEVESFLNA